VTEVDLTFGSIIAYGHWIMDHRNSIADAFDWSIVGVDDIYHHRKPSKLMRVHFHVHLEVRKPKWLVHPPVAPAYTYLPVDQYRKIRHGRCKGIRWGHFKEREFWNSYGYLYPYGKVTW